MNTNIQHGNPFEEGWILDECEAIRRAERHEDRVYSESLPGVYPPCNPIKPTVLAVISGRSEDGTMFYSKGGMWSSYIESHCVMNYSIAARYVRMRKHCSKFKFGVFGEQMYGVRVRRIGVES